MTAAERLESLLALEVTEGLDGAGSREMLDLLGRTGGESRRFELERAAAAADLAFGVGAVEMPDHVLARIRDQAWGYTEGARASSPESVEPPSSLAPRRASSSSSPIWLLAAAMAVAAIVGWWPRLPWGAATAPEEIAQSTLEGDPSLLAVPLAATDDPAARGASGRLEWSPELQRGVMRIDGLAANDPSRWQYQLWIFDATRDERFPVDGGVFDIPADGAVSVPVSAPIAVREPTLFAVTVEAPGGVVVSDRERIVLVGETPHGRGVPASS